MTGDHLAVGTGFVEVVEDVVTGDQVIAEIVFHAGDGTGRCRRGARRCARRLHP